MNGNRKKKNRGNKKNMFLLIHFIGSLNSSYNKASQISLRNDFLGNKFKLDNLLNKLIIDTIVESYNNVVSITKAESFS